MNYDYYKIQVPKIYIDDKTIQKVPLINIHKFNIEQSKIIQAYHKKLLLESKNTNDSNETALIIRIDMLNNSEGLWLKGDANSIILGGTVVEQKVKHSPNNTVFMLHNHPQQVGFSYEDIKILIDYSSVYGMTAITNYGDIHVLCKRKNFNLEQFITFCNVNKQSIKNKYDVCNKKDMQNALALEIVKNASSVGLYYKHERV